MKRLHIIVSGKVQGVAFRANTLKTANSLMITGWVRNLVSGDVEIIAEGPHDKLLALLNWCQQGPSLAQVTQIHSDWSNTNNEFDSFEIR